MRKIEKLIEFTTDDLKLELLMLSSFSIDSAIDQTTARATITIPYIGKFYPSSSKRNNALTKVSPYELTFTNSDESSFTLLANKSTVTIAAGFEGTRTFNPDRKLFRGIVTEFRRNGDHIEIKCEDPMGALKNNRFNWSFSGGTLLDVLQYGFELSKNELNADNANQVTNFGEGEGSVNTGSFNISDSFSGRYFIDDVRLPGITIEGYLSLIEVLELLKEHYGVYTYFREFFRTDTIDGEEIDDSILMLHSGRKFFNGNNPFTVSKYSYPYKRGTNVVFGEPNMIYNTFNKNTDLSVLVTSRQKSSTRRLGTIDGETILTDYTPTLTGDEQNINTISSKALATQVNSRQSRISINLPNLDDDTLVLITKSKWDNVPEAGLQGNFTGLLLTALERSDLVDFRFEDDYSRYYIDRVFKQFNSSTGLTQTIYIKNKLKSLEE